MGEGIGQFVLVRNSVGHDHTHTQTCVPVGVGQAVQYLVGVYIDHTVTQLEQPLTVINVKLAGGVGGGLLYQDNVACHQIGSVDFRCLDALQTVELGSSYTLATIQRGNDSVAELDRSGIGFLAITGRAGTGAAGVYLVQKSGGGHHIAGSIIVGYALAAGYIVDHLQQVQILHRGVLTESVDSGLHDSQIFLAHRALNINLVEGHSSAVDLGCTIQGLAQVGFVILGLQGVGDGFALLGCQGEFPFQLISADTVAAADVLCNCRDLVSDGHGLLAVAVVGDHHRVGDGLAGIYCGSCSVGGGLVELQITSGCGLTGGAVHVVAVIRGRTTIVAGGAAAVITGGRTAIITGGATAVITGGRTTVIVGRAAIVVSAATVIVGRTTVVGATAVIVGRATVVVGVAAGRIGAIHRGATGGQGGGVISLRANSGQYDHHCHSDHCNRSNAVQSVGAVLPSPEGGPKRLYFVPKFFHSIVFPFVLHFLGVSKCFFYIIHQNRADCKQPTKMFLPHL